MVEEIEKWTLRKKKERLIYYCNDCGKFFHRPPKAHLRKGHTVFVELEEW